jgi:hypothetical protein
MDKYISLSWTALYGWLALWGLLVLNVIPTQWVTSTAALAFLMMILDIGLIIAHIKHKNRLKQTKLRDWIK